MILLDHELLWRDYGRGLEWLVFVSSVRKPLTAGRFCLRAISVQRWDKNSAAL